MTSAPPATIKSVARHAGVAASTVSDVMGDRWQQKRISHATATRVRAAAAELAYHPSSSARALRRQRTNTLALLRPTGAGPGLIEANYMDALAAIDPICRARGYELRTGFSDLTNAQTFTLPPSISSRGVDGVILAEGIETAVARRFRDFGVPCVLLGCDVDDPDLMPSLYSKREMLRARLGALRYLAGLGHRRIGYFSGQWTSSPEMGGEFFAAATADPLLAGCRVEALDFRSFGQTFDAGAALASRWLQTPVEHRPTAIMACEHPLMEFLAALHERSYHCPQDVSVLSLDDSHLCARLTPRVTALSWSFPDAAAAAVNLLLDHLEHGRPLDPAAVPEFRHRLIVRGSCAPPIPTDTSQTPSPFAQGERTP